MSLYTCDNNNTNNNDSIGHGLQFSLFSMFLHKPAQVAPFSPFVEAYLVPMLIFFENTFHYTKVVDYFGFRQ